jgi:HSP20 family protein
MERVDPLRDCRPIREEELDELPERHQGDRSTVLAYDVYKEGNELVIEFDVPGVAPEVIDLAVEDRTLTLAIRRSLAHGNGIDVIDAGRAHGTFTQRLLLGSRWEPSGLTASLKHGVLSVRAPLAARHRRTIAIEPAERSAVDQEIPYAERLTAAVPSAA